MAKQAVDEAFRLDPNLPEVHIALGLYHYRSNLDYDRALEHFATARKSQPNNSKLLDSIAAVQRRQGRFEQALANFKRASELDPRSNNLLFEVANTHKFLRNYPEAERWYERAISLRPDIGHLYECKAWVYVLAEGSTERARAILEEASQNIKTKENVAFANLLVTLDTYDGNYQEALNRLSVKSEDINRRASFTPNALRYARIYRYMNKDELAKKYFDDARSILEKKIQEQPEDSRFRSALGITYTGLGRKQDAIREGELAVELLPVSKEALQGFYRAKDLARIYVMVGEFDAAIDQLKFLLSIPGEMSIPLLKLDPTWDPLRDHPRFKKLIETKK
jgi:serine/threonine-protein kinase